MAVLDPNALVAAIPATIAACAALAAARRGKHIANEVRSPNGSTTAQAVQDIKVSVAGIKTEVAETKAEVAVVRTNAALHEAKDAERHAAVVNEQARQRRAIVALRGAEGA